MSRPLKRLGPSALRYCGAIAREPRKRQHAVAEHVMRRYISAHYERSEPQHLDRWPKRMKRAKLNARICEKRPSVGVQGPQAEKPDVASSNWVASICEATPATRATAPHHKRVSAFSCPPTLDVKGTSDTEACHESKRL